MAKKKSILKSTLHASKSALSLSTVACLFLISGPIYIPYKLISRYKEHQKLKEHFEIAQSEVQKHSNRTFTKFKDIMYHPKLTRKLRLLICKMIVQGVIDTVSLSKLVSNTRTISFIDTIEELNLDVMINACPNGNWLIKVMDSLPYSPPEKLLLSLTKTMNVRSIRFKSVNIFDQQDEQIQLSLTDNDNFFNNLKFNYSHFAMKQLAYSGCFVRYNTASMLLEPSHCFVDSINSLQIFSYTDISKLVSLPNLREVVLITPVLYKSITAEKIYELLLLKPNLNRLKVKFISLSDNTKFTSMNYLHDISIVYAETKIMLYYDEVRDNSNEIPVSEKKLDVVYNAVGSTESLFVSICLPLEKLLIRNLVIFSKLTQLTINVLNYNGDLMSLKNSSIKVLSFIRINSNPYPIKLNLNNITKLRSLSFTECLVHSSTFNNTPDSLTTLIINSSKLQGGPITLPRKLHSLILFDTFPDINEPPDPFPSLKVELSWALGKIGPSLLKFIDSISEIIADLKLKPLNSYPSYIELVTSNTYSNFLSDYKFGINISELIQMYGYLKTELELEFLDTSQSFSDILTASVMVCVNLFKTKPKLIKDKKDLKPIKKFQCCLVDAFKVEFNGVRFNLAVSNVTVVGTPGTLDFLNIPE